MVARTIGIVVLVAALIGVVLLPFWIALIHYPVTQTPIPHPSRANFILSPQWGLNYFIVPYGALILALPFIFWRGSSVRRLRPLAIWLLDCVPRRARRNNTGGAHLLLGRAFEVLTMERFTTGLRLLALPFIGLLAAELVDRFQTPAIVGSDCAGGARHVRLAVGWATFRPADAEDFKVDSAAAWLNRDGHDQYRYITLGFGNKIARLAMMTDAGSVDGEWNSGRMLPELTQNGAGALTSSKYFGKAGIDALRAILKHADHYGMKWVFVRDHYYDPLLVIRRLAARRQSREQHNHRLEQGWDSPCDSVECSSDSTALAGIDVGHPADWQQHSCVAGATHSGKKTVWRAGSNPYPAEEKSCSGRLARE